MLGLVDMSNRITLSTVAKEVPKFTRHKLTSKEWEGVGLDLDYTLEEDIDLSQPMVISAASASTWTYIDLIRISDTGVPSKATSSGATYAEQNLWSGLEATAINGHYRSDGVFVLCGAQRMVVFKAEMAGYAPRITKIATLNHAGVSFKGGAFSGNTLYLAAGINQNVTLADSIALSAYDLSNPAAPTVLGTLSGAALVTNGRTPNHVVGLVKSSVSDIVYIGFSSTLTNTAQRIHIAAVNVANPAAMSVVGIGDITVTTGVVAPDALMEFEVPGYIGAATQNRFIAVDARNLSAITQVGGYSLSSSTAKDVMLLRPYVAVAAYTGSNNGVHVFTAARKTTIPRSGVFVGHTPTKIIRISDTLVGLGTDGSQFVMNDYTNLTAPVGRGNVYVTAAPAALLYGMIPKAENP